MSNITENEKLVCVIGLGYVGLPLAIELSEVYKTTGYDINKKRIDQLKKFNDTTNEVDPSRIETSKINFTNSATKIADYDYYIVTVPTPVDTTDSPNLDPLKNATKLIGESMKEGS